ncbi:MAG: hypothetical protein Q8P56_00745 [Candidatus Uhrbacteria bacterium]|nr:hypothetical protein [Candidatus Uhrbacteria bacterium]
MTRERFAEILKEYGFTDEQIKLLWDAEPPDDLDEQKLREIAVVVAPVKDFLVQA